MGLSIPLSIMLTFPVMALLDINLNLVSLAGLALAVGMLVDNSIVVLENIFRHREELGEDPVTAAIEGASEVGMAIGASTLTTLAVFIPIMLVPGIAGQIFHDLSVTVSSTLIVSLFVALSLIPLVTSRMKTIRLTDNKESKAAKHSFTRKISEGISKAWTILIRDMQRLWPQVSRKRKQSLLLQRYFSMCRSLSPECFPLNSYLLSITDLHSLSSTDPPAHHWSQPTVQWY